MPSSVRVQTEGREKKKERRKSAHLCIALGSVEGRSSVLEFLPGQRLLRRHRRRSGGAGEDSTPTATETGDYGQGRGVPPPMMISVAAVAWAHKRPPSLRKTPVAHSSRQHRAAATAFPERLCSLYYCTDRRPQQRPPLPPWSTDCAGCSDEQQDEAGIRAVAVLRRRFELVDR